MPQVSKEWQKEQRRKYLRNELESSKEYRENLESACRSADRFTLLLSLNESFLKGTITLYALNIIANSLNRMASLNIDQDTIASGSMLAAFAVSGFVARRAMSKWSERMSVLFPERYIRLEDDKIELILHDEFDQKEQS